MYLEAVRSTAMFIINPDAVYRRLVRPIFDEILEEGMSILAVRPVEALTEQQLEELFRLHIAQRQTLEGPSVWWMNRQVFETGPVLLVFVTIDDVDELFCKVSDLKRRIRRELEATNRNLALVHASDSWSDAAREAMIFLTPDEWLGVLWIASQQVNCKSTWYDTLDIDKAMNFPVASLEPEQVVNSVSSRLWLLEDWYVRVSMNLDSGSSRYIQSSVDSMLVNKRSDTQILLWKNALTRPRCPNALKIVDEMKHISRRWPQGTWDEIALFERLGNDLQFKLRQWERLVLLTTSCYGAQI